MTLTLSELSRRLTQHLRTQVLNGEHTERGLARRSGISQPHVHHILSGRRAMTLRAADALMTATYTTAEELLTVEELARCARRHAALTGGTFRRAA